MRSLANNLNLRDIFSFYFSEFYVSLSYGIAIYAIIQSSATLESLFQAITPLLTPRECCHCRHWPTLLVAIQKRSDDIESKFRPTSNHRSNSLLVNAVIVTNETIAKGRCCFWKHAPGTFRSTLEIHLDVFYKLCLCFDAVVRNDRNKHATN